MTARRARWLGLVLLASRMLCDPRGAYAEESISKGTQAENEDEPKQGHGRPPILDAYLRARCATALCLSSDNDGDESAPSQKEKPRAPVPDNWLGIEPLVELPIGKSFGVGNGSLAQYVNNHDLKVQLAAGLRVWLFRDLISFSLYLSIPLTSTGVRLVGSSFTYPAASIRRPYPGFSIGLLFDALWISVDHDELRNGDAIDSSAYNPEFPANVRVSSCTTITVALQLVTATRALFGLLQKR